MLPSFTYCVNAAMNMNVQKSVYASYLFGEIPRSGIARLPGSSPGGSRVIRSGDGVGILGKSYLIRSIKKD